MGGRAGGAQAALRAEVVAQALQAQRARTSQAILEGVPAALRDGPADPRGAGRARPRRASARGYGDLLKPVAFRGELIFARGRALRAARAVRAHGHRGRDAGGRAPLPHPLRPGHPRGAGEVVRRTRRPPQAGQVVPADEVVETEFGLALAADVAAIEAAEPAGVVRLLPAFDQYVVAAPRDERATPAPERIYRPGGWFSPVLLVDGVMAGVWALEDGVVTIEPFGDARQGRARGRRGRGGAAPGAPPSAGELISAARRRSSPSPPPTAPAGAGSAPLWPSASASSSSTARSRRASPTACGCRSTTRSPTTSRSATRSGASPRPSRCCPSSPARWSRPACSRARTTGARPRR